MTQFSAGGDPPPPPPQSHPSPPPMQYAQPGQYAQAGAYVQPGPYGQPVGNGLGIAGGVVGIVAIVLFWFPFLNLVLGVVGVSLGIAGLTRANRLPGSPSKGMAITGIVCGGIALLFGLLIIIGLMTSGSVHFGA